MRNTPFPPADANYIFVYGMGIGRTEHDAEFSAWKNALYKALNEGGLVGIETQSKTLDQVFSMEELKTKLPENLLQRRLVCQTLPIYISKEKMKVYILIQVQRDGRQPANFYSHDLNFITCEPSDFLRELKEHNKRIIENDTSKLIGKNAYYSKGKHVLINGREVEENDVRTLFANSEPYKLYASGIGWHKAACALYWTGSSISYVALLAMIIGESVESGIYVVGGGIAVVLIGVMCNVIGNNKISKSIKLYNNNKRFSSLPIKLNLGITPNGIGITLNF